MVLLVRGASTDDTDVEVIQSSRGGHAAVSPAQTAGGHGWKGVAGGGLPLIPSIGRRSSQRPGGRNAAQHVAFRADVLNIRVPSPEAG